MYPKKPLSVQIKTAFINLKDYIAKTWTLKHLFYRAQQLFIILAHLLLLKWMLVTLSEAGHWSMTQVVGHFAGMALYGALLIRGTALWAQYHYSREKIRHVVS